MISAPYRIVKYALTLTSIALTSIALIKAVNVLGIEFK